MVAYDEKAKEKFRFGCWWMWDKIFFEPEITAWALIPPLPEKSQEEKDEELWHKFADAPRDKLIQDPRNAFMAGLKAARE